MACQTNSMSFDFKFELCRTWSLCQNLMYIPIFETVRKSSKMHWVEWKCQLFVSDGVVIHFPCSCNHVEVATTTDAQLSRNSESEVDGIDRHSYRSGHESKRVDSDVCQVDCAAVMPIDDGQTLNPNENAKSQEFRKEFQRTSRFKDVSTSFRTVGQMPDRCKYNGSRINTHFFIKKK
eukprot:223690_1